MIAESNPGSLPRACIKLGLWAAFSACAWLGLFYLFAFYRGLPLDSRDGLTWLAAIVVVGPIQDHGVRVILRPIARRFHWPLAIAQGCVFVALVWRPLLEPLLFG